MKEAVDTKLPSLQDPKILRYDDLQLNRGV